jgi:hypothetical protein
MLMSNKATFGIRHVARLAVALLALSACSKDPAAESEIAGARGMTPDRIIESVRAELFKGPVRSIVDVDNLAPDKLSPASRLGITARWNFDREIAMAYIRAAGIKWLRLGIDENSQEVLDLAKRYEIKVLAQLGYGPVTEMTPKELAAWYLKKAVPLIDKNRSVIAAVQIWNEPFNFPHVEKNGKKVGAWPTRYGGKWFGGAYVGPFADFTSRVATGLRKEFPDLVLIGGTKMPGSTLELIQDSNPPLDAVYLQPYPRTWPPELLRVLNDPVHTFSSNYQLTSAIDVFLDKARKAADNPELALWIPEIGATTYKRDKKNRNYPHPPVSEELQAKMYARIWASYMAADVDRLFYFLLNDKQRNAQATMPQRHFSIVDSNWRPKQAYYVLARLNALTGGEVTPDASIRWTFEGDAKFAKSSVRSLPAPARGTVKYKPELQVRGFATGKGWKMIAIWTDETFPADKKLVKPRNIRIGLNGGFRCEVIIVDPLKGDSRFENPAISGGKAWVQLAVRDYPVLILTTQSDDQCNDS